MNFSGCDPTGTFLSLADTLVSINGAQTRPATTFTINRFSFITDILSVTRFHALLRQWLFADTVRANTRGLNFFPWDFAGSSEYSRSALRPHFRTAANWIRKHRLLYGMKPRTTL